jgi:hypothetical protein
MAIWKTEPALISGLVAAALVLAVSFGAPISDDQQKAVLGFTAAALMLLQAVVTRQNVVPVVGAATSWDCNRRDVCGHPRRPPTRTPGEGTALRDVPALGIHGSLRGVLGGLAT